MHVAVNGVKLFVEVLGPKLQPKGPEMVERPTVVALHGGPTDHAHMRAMVEGLTDVAQVVVYDHRGCGRSEAGDPADWSMNQWADDVRGLCDALGIVSPVVVGHSFGGFVAQVYAIRHPGHAGRLVFSGTGPTFDVAASTEGFRRQGGDVAADAFAAFAARPDRETVVGFLGACRNLYSVSRQMDPDAEARTRANLDLTLDFFARVAPAYDVRDGLGSVETPVLIIGGDEDPITPPEYHDVMERSLTRAPVKRLRFANAGHTLAKDAPDAWDQALRSWITDAGGA